VSLGAGQHIYNLNPAVLPFLALSGNIAGTLSITAAFLSKTSFGVTLLRLTTCNWAMKWFIYFLLVTMNVALALSAVLIWARCAPIAKAWHVEMEGTCWKPFVNTKYGLFSGGELDTAATHVQSAGLTSRQHSILGLC
jgi:hypothetical protein